MTHSEPGNNHDVTLPALLPGSFEPHPCSALNTYEDVVFKNAGSVFDPAFDGNVTSAFDGCTRSMELPAGQRGAVIRIRFLPQTDRYYSVKRGAFQASNDKTTWTTLFTAPGESSVTDGWNVFDIAAGRSIGSLPRYRYFRWVADPLLRWWECQGFELQFIGRIVAAETSGSDAAAAPALPCPVATVVWTPALSGAISAESSASVTAPSTLNITVADTPTVTSITPDVGSALGGLTVTIGGSGFTPGVESVKLNGIPCAVVPNSVSQDGTSVQCVTGKRTAFYAPSIKLMVTGRGRALANHTAVAFRYLDRWSVRSTWMNDEPPSEGDTVLVPVGQAILVDVSPPKLNLVLVQGEMVFDHTLLAQPGAPQTFDAHYIAVIGGKFRVGTSAKPYLGNLTMTIHGRRATSIELPGFGAKCLGVMNGMRGMTNSMDADEEAAIVAQRSPALAAALSSQSAALTAMKALMGADFGLSLGSYDKYVDATMAAAMGGANSANAADLILNRFMVANGGEPVPASLQGVIELHGAPRQRVWTFASNTAPAGTTTLKLREPVDWAPGEVIVTSPSGTNYSQAERRIVASRPDSRTVELTEPLAFTHECFTYASSAFGFTDTSICFEAGLLSRNVIIQGDEFSEAEQFGWHSLAMNGATFQAENTEMRGCGE